MIRIENLYKKFQTGDSELIALKGLSFSIPQGQFVAITGRSGSGKSTLLYQLGLLDHPTTGEIYIDNMPTSSLSTDERTLLRLQDLGYVFQDYAVLPTLTALENVMVPLLMLGHSTDKAISLAAKALTRVGLGDRLHNTPSKLSGGQQQRVAIARAIAHEPKILFADEPTANLDSETSQTVLDVFHELHREGQTLVMVTHEPEYAKQTERIIILADGEIIEDKKM